MYKICKTPKSEARQMEFQETLLKMLKKQKTASDIFARGWIFLRLLIELDVKGKLAARRDLSWQHLDGVDLRVGGVVAQNTSRYVVDRLQGVWVTEMKNGGDLARNDHGVDERLCAPC